MKEAKIDGWRARSGAALMACYMMSVEEIADLLLAGAADDMDEVEALSMCYEIRREVLTCVSAGALEDDDSEET